MFLCFYRQPRADNSVVSGGIVLKFEFIQTFMHGLDTCKSEEDRVKNEGVFSDYNR